VDGHGRESGSRLSTSDYGNFVVRAQRMLDEKLHFPPRIHPEMVWCSGTQQASWPFATAKVESSPNMESMRIRGAFKPLRFLACQRCRRPDRGTIVQIVAVAYRRALASVSATADVRRSASSAFADVSRSVC
jgi:hypothetical protein